MDKSNTHRIGVFNPSGSESYIKTQNEVLETIARRQNALLKALELLAGQMTQHPDMHQTLDDIEQARAAAHKLQATTRRLGNAVINMRRPDQET